jgi:glycosyltransferase involved in cell wall biosynthesis
VVDNGSTDNTAAVAAAHGAQVVREPLRGFGAACWAGVQAASGEVLVFADADGSFDGADLPAVAGPVLRGEADLVVGSRLARRERGAMSALAVLENRLLVEVPVRYRPRAGGRSKVSGSVGGTVRAVTAMAAVTLALLRQRRWTRAAG